MFRADTCVVAGPIAEFTYLSAKGSTVTKGFCPACGSPIYGRNTLSPDHITFPLGTMDNTDGLRVEVVIFERDKPHWDQLEKNVAFFATQPDWRPPE